MTALTRDELEIRFALTESDEHWLEELKNLPSLFGGDGRSVHSPIFVNSVSHAMGRRLMTHFISSHYGTEGKDWILVDRYQVSNSRQPDLHIEYHAVETLSGEKVGWYFDLSRSHGNGLRLIRQAYELRVLDQVKAIDGVMQ